MEETSVELLPGVAYQHAFPQEGRTTGRLGSKRRAEEQIVASRGLRLFPICDRKGRPPGRSRSPDRSGRHLAGRSRPRTLPAVLSQGQSDPERPLGQSRDRGRAGRPLAQGRRQSGVREETGRSSRLKDLSPRLVRLRPLEELFPPLKRLHPSGIDPFAPPQRPVRSGFDSLAR